MLKVENDGATKLEHLESVAKRVHVPELEYPAPHQDSVYILNHFYQLKKSKGEKIDFTEISHYSELMALNLQPFEVSMIMDIDRIFENSVN